MGHKAELLNMTAEHARLTDDLYACYLQINLRLGKLATTVNAKSTVNRKLLLS